jgi:hypothetical protein
MEQNGNLFYRTLTSESYFNRMIKLFAIFLLFCFTLSASAQKKTDESAIEKFVLRLHEKKFRWMEKKQLDSLTMILDDRVVYVHSNGWVQNKKEITDDLQSGKLIMNSVTISEATARVYKGAVIINGKGLFNVVVNGNAVNIELLYTEIYVRKKEGWLLVSRHANKLQ